jgi:heme-degrading monooxygenase HmoA
LVQFVWEFVVRSDKVGEFERHYSATGTWAELFRKSPGYRETLLLRDVRQPNRYLTLDRWDDIESRQAMRQKSAREYEEIDRMCEAFTETEKDLGVFKVI